MHTTQAKAATLPPIQSTEPMLAEEMLDISQLRDRGWTRQMVSRFLGSPDSHRPATQGGGGRPAELFRISRVRNAERLVAFTEARRAALERSELARRSQQDRRALVLRFASTLDLALPKQSLVHALRSVRASALPGSTAENNIDGDRAVRLLLGMLVDSSNRLDVFQGQPGIRDARALLLDRKLALIASRYPVLGASCNRVKLEQAQDNESLFLP